MLKIGIVGLPNVGKSTLFKALTKQRVDISNYPFCTIDPNIGVVKVPDERLNKLAKAFPRPKIIPAVVEFVDIAGLVKGASVGEGLGNKFLAHIREVDAILEIVRVFEKEDVAHVNQTIDPKRDIEILETELILADLETVNKRLEKLEKQLKTQDKQIKKEYEFLLRIKKELENGKKVIDIDLSDEEKELIKDLFLLTAKPILYLYNYNGELPNLSDDLRKKNHILLDIKLEEELSEMAEKEIKELGIQPKIYNLIKESYKLLDLITFFTMNENEIRAWEVKNGTKAPEAGGKIHSDFEEKFIKAEVIPWDKLIEAGSWHNAKEKGILKIVGKDYIVLDGDVIYFVI
ncbi:redox-regulated ATPase YchF [bacterium]|nr:redox-regulated ATPase YchF [bacterium]